MDMSEPPPSSEAVTRSGPDLTDRRESDRALRFWTEREHEQSRAGLRLDVALPDTWAHCFVLLPRPQIEDSVLLAYGKDFAHSFDLPMEAVPPVPIAGKLPRRVAELLLRGCADARQQDAVIRSEGEIEFEDGHHELYRAAFIPVHDSRPEPRVFGSFNSKTAPGGALASPRPAATGGFWQRLKSRLSSKPR